MNGRKEAIEQLRKAAKDIEKEWKKEMELQLIDKFEELLKESTINLSITGGAKVLNIIVDEESELYKAFNSIFKRHGYPGIKVKLGEYDLWMHTTCGELFIRIGPFPESYVKRIPFIKAYIPKFNVSLVKKYVEDRKRYAKQHIDDADYGQAILDQLL